jgi:transcriptional regulator with XRE-family HTH domain
VDSKLLGSYLKDRRAKLNPVDFGISPIRRRTPGLRREEVANRANVSATWYTWLEQGRGGSPSAEVLNRIAEALGLTPVEREHLFFLAQQRAPQVHYQAWEPISPQLQRVLDSLEYSPAMVKTPTWDIIAWNEAARAVLKDYSKMAPEQRNILRILFGDPRVKEHMVNWLQDATFAVAAFRSEVMRAGAMDSVQPLIDELCQSSSEFNTIWQNYDVQQYGEGIKHTRLPLVGECNFEYSSFAVDGRADLGLVIYTPSRPIDREKTATLIAHWRQQQRG